MTLRSRLNQIYGNQASALSEGAGQGVSNGNGALRRRLQKVEDRTSSQEKRSRLDPEAMGRYLKGTWEEHQEGRVLVVEKRYPARFRQGRLALKRFFDLQSEPLRLLANDREFEFDPEDLLFFDTETTGLAGGAGTYVFLIGVGFFRHDEFRLFQLFLPDYASERVFLDRLAELMDDGGRPFRQLVSFNGKSYDLNLLANRFILQRRPDPFAGLRHLDLIHPCRILWRGCFENCALQTLERNLLDLQRQDDIPSHLIPQTYFDFLRTGNFRPLASVFQHNRIDIVSMVALLSLAASVVKDPVRHNFADPLSAARLHQLRGSYENAARILEKALSVHDSTSRTLAWLRELAYLKKRLGHPEAALDLWREYLMNHPHPPREAYEEAAKILEHQSKDLDSALRTVDRALDAYPDHPALSHRRYRLHCKIQGRLWWKTA
ncbi:MAG TPA: ribonuclease H-like domain-containing protein [Acidobacteriota bacterium]|nr:ribonuclease H-like domain-containing protein [Acidobacteriota bacterium]